MIEQAARGRNHHVHAAAKGMLLGAHAHTAEHGRAVERGVHGQIVHVLEDLGGELAGGRQHERARHPSGTADQLVQNRQQERRGLAAAGHRACQQVAPRHRRRNGVSLNGGRTSEPEVFEATEKIGVKLQCSERQKLSFGNGHYDRLQAPGSRLRGLRAPGFGGFRLPASGSRLRGLMLRAYGLWLMG